MIALRISSILFSKSQKIKPVQCTVVKKDTNVKIVKKVVKKHAIVVHCFVHITAVKTAKLHIV